ncbi:MAG TPA: hypothetical protein PKM78_16200 [Anaerolineae bacterium]|nr:hypothetical protein [Anaerolineae bacterium]HNU05634.1 hypothetical protein [Anaerolineae bacterium]
MTHGDASTPAVGATGDGDRVHVLLVALLCAAAAAPLLKPGYFWGAHDARHDVYFIFEYLRGVQGGDWLARWSPDFSWGYGYPFFLIYGPFTSFLGAVLVGFLNFGYTQAVEALFAAAIIVSGLAMYGFVRSWLGRNAGLVAAVAYVFLPYRLVEVYVRASLAEYVALMWLPLILWSVRAAFQATRPVDRASSAGRHAPFLPLLAAALSYAGLMITSNLVALIFTPLLALYCLLLLLNRIDEEQPLRGLSRESFFPLVANVIRVSAASALGLLLGLLLSAFFWMPALSEGGLVNQDQWYGGYYDPELHFVYPHQLLEPGWGFGISQPGPDDVQQGALSFQLGAAPLALAVIALFGLAAIPAGRRRELWLLLLWLLLAIFLMLPISAWAWRNVGFVSFAQFPWRWLMIAALPLAVLAGSAALLGGRLSRTLYPEEELGPPSRGLRQPGAPANNRLNLATLLLALLLILGSYPYLRVETIDPTPQQGPVSPAALMRFQQSSNEMTGAPQWVDLSQRPLWSDMAELYVQADNPPLSPDASAAEIDAAIARQLAAVTSKVDYRLMPQNETLAVWSEELGAAHERLWVHAGAPGQEIVFNIAWFPGWRAYLLGGETGPVVAELPLAREDGPLARIVVPVPEGENYILLRFEDTPVRIVGKAVTAVGLLLLLAVALAGLVFWRWRRSEGRPVSPRRSGF